MASNHLQRIIDTFEASLGQSYSTRLVGGFGEPEYLPATADNPAEIRFREDFLSSALHEVAHWCIAGAERRLLHDFGYWYWPEGRNAEQQLAFEQAEVRPQALEWIFSNACGQAFHLSRDNHDPESTQARFDLAAAVGKEALLMCDGALPAPAAIFAEALALVFDQPQYRNPEYYAEARIR